MKYKHIVVLATSFSILSLGCQKDFLDTNIKTQRTPESLASDRGTLFSSAWAFYTPLSQGFSTLDDNLFASVSDEAQNSSSSATGYLYFNQGLVNANFNPVSGIYKTYYEGIRAANNFLDYSANSDAFLVMNRDVIADASQIALDKKSIAWFKAEAHIAKAYYYAELIKRYGGVPIVTETLQKSGVKYIPKSTYEEVVDYIVSEIDNNKANLQVNWKTSSDFASSDGRFSLGSALAIKARVLLYAASPRNNPTNDVVKWQKAAAAANELMTTPGLGYALDASYGGMFIGGATLTSNEPIFVIRGGSSSTFEKANYPIATAGGNSGIAPSDNLVSDYEYIGAVDPTDPYKNRDPRLAASIVVNGSTWNSRTIDQSPGATDDMTKANTSKTGYYLRKFMTDNLDLQNGGAAFHHWIAYRYAEVLLNYAEAMNEAYGPTNNNGYGLTATQAINLVRARASASLAPISGATQSSFRTAVKHERRIELAFEDHRYWDLLRWKDAGTVLNAPIVGVKVTKVNSVFQYQKVNIATRTFNESAHYYFPFTRSEIVNSNGALIQNPGY